MSVRIVATTDMPGRNLPASGLSGLIRNLTGMRCTTLVKLPVALSGGSRANCAPLAGAMRSTCALMQFARESVDRISTRCPVRHG